MYYERQDHVTHLCDICSFCSDSETRDSLEITEQKKVDKNGRKATKKKFLHDLYDKSLVASKETCAVQTLVKKGTGPKCSRTHGEVRERNLKKNKKKDLKSRVDHEGRPKKSLEAIGVESNNGVQAKSSVDFRLKRNRYHVLESIGIIVKNRLLLH